MKLRQLPTILILTGVLLWLSSVAWQRYAGVGTVWTDQQAAEYARAAAEVHQLVNAHPEEGSQPPGDLQSARSRFAEIEAQRDRAIATQDIGKRTLQILSGLCLVGGIVTYGMQRARAD